MTLFFLSRHNQHYNQYCQRFLITITLIFIITLLPTNKIGASQEYTSCTAWGNQDESTLTIKCSPPGQPSKRFNPAQPDFFTFSQFHLERSKKRAEDKQRCSTQQFYGNTRAPLLALPAVPQIKPDQPNLEQLQPMHPLPAIAALPAAPGYRERHLIAPQLPSRQHLDSSFRPTDIPTNIPSELWRKLGELNAALSRAEETPLHRETACPDNDEHLGREKETSSTDDDMPTLDSDEDDGETILPTLQRQPITIRSRRTGPIPHSAPTSYAAFEKLFENENGVELDSDLEIEETINPEEGPA